MTFKEYFISEKEETKTELVDKDMIQSGDVIIFKGKETTVTQKDFGKDELLGRTIFGDSFKNGKEKIKRVLYKKYKEGKFVGYVPQP